MPVTPFLSRSLSFNYSYPDRCTSEHFLNRPFLGNIKRCLALLTQKKGYDISNDKIKSFYHFISCITSYYLTMILYWIIFHIISCSVISCYVLFHKLYFIILHCFFYYWSLSLSLLPFLSPSLSLSLFSSSTLSHFLSLVLFSISSFLSLP